MILSISQDSRLRERFGSEQMSENTTGKLRAFRRIPFKLRSNLLPSLSGVKIMWPLTNGFRSLAGPEAALLRGCVGMMVDGLVAELNASPDPSSPDPDGNPDFDDNESEYEGDDLLDGFGFLAPNWYTMWEPEQRVWLLERVTTSLLGARSAPPQSAIFEATIEAVYVELADLIAMEITTGTPIERGSWRASLLDAYVQRCPEDSISGGLHFEVTTIDPCLPPAVSRQWKATHPETPSISGCDSNDESLSQTPAPSPGYRDQPAAGRPDWMTWWMSVIERLVDATYGPRLYHGGERFRDGDPALLKRYLHSKGVNEKFMQRIPPLRSRSQTQAAVERIQTIVIQRE